MLVAGITGGIGSGKSVVSQVFQTLGIPVFNADNAARQLMENDPDLKRQISLLLGDSAYIQDKLDREKISAIVFHNPEKLQQLNALVHPAVINYTRHWLKSQDAPYVIKEAALLFESGSYKETDVIIGIFAPLELRIQRAMKRSFLSREQVLAIIASQMDENEKMKRCSYIITNDDIMAVLPQVLKLHDILSKEG